MPLSHPELLPPPDLPEKPPPPAVRRSGPTPPAPLLAPRHGCSVALVSQAVEPNFQYRPYMEEPCGPGGPGPDQTGST